MDDLEFPAFFAGQYGRLYWLGFLLTGDRGAAEDLAQGALVRTFWMWSRVCTYDRPDHGEDAMVLWAAVQRLAVRQRAVLVLRYHEDLSEAEVARLLRLPLGTVKTLARRGLASCAPSWPRPTRTSCASTRRRTDEPRAAAQGHAGPPRAGAGRDRRLPPVPAPPAAAHPPGRGRRRAHTGPAGRRGRGGATGPARAGRACPPRPGTTGRRSWSGREPWGGRSCVWTADAWWCGSAPKAPPARRSAAAPRLTRQRSRRPAPSCT